MEDTLIKDLQLNDQIRDREVRLIGKDGEMLGVMPSAEANRLAEQANLDLVKISPTANPPVCKIMDYGKYRFEQTKRERDARKNQKVVEIKEVRISATIDVGDMKTKAKSAAKFLQAGDKVTVSIRMKGRQQAHPDIAMRNMNEFFEMVSEFCTKEKEPSQSGRMISMTLLPNVKKQ